MELLEEAHFGNIKPISLLPTNFAQVPREEDTGEDVAGWRSGLAMSHVDEGQAQALSTMGRTLQHRRGHTPRHLQAKRFDGNTLTNIWNIEQLCCFFP